MVTVKHAISKNPVRNKLKIAHHRGTNITGIYHTLLAENNLYHILYGEGTSTEKAKANRLHNTALKMAFDNGNVDLLHAAEHDEKLRKILGIDKKNPYKSTAQRGKFHAMERRGEISPNVMCEFDRESKGMRLPKHVNGQDGNNAKLVAMLTLEGRRNEDTKDTRDAEHTLKTRYGWTDAMIKKWRNRRIPVHMRSRNNGATKVVGAVNPIQKQFAVSWTTKQGTRPQPQPQVFDNRNDAEMFARLLKNKGRIVTIKEHTIKKRNATASDFKQHQKAKLTELSKTFQGRVNGERRKVLESDYTPKDKYRLGKLVQLKIKDGGKVIPIDFDGESYLASDLKNNLWIVGKDARIENIKLPPQGQLKYLGELIQIDYVTAKSHIEGGKTVRYYHKLGEVTKEMPNLFVDSEGFPIIVSGNYDIWDVGIVN